ncbi:hypothetical protein FACS1894195_0050 [Bacteroidia bacterium]|nr:hypothetical protein FACS1894195_0050 [Bacteroidia bacterium]
MKVKQIDLKTIELDLEIATLPSGAYSIEIISYVNCCPENTRWADKVGVDGVSSHKGTKYNPDKRTITVQNLFFDKQSDENLDDGIYEFYIRILNVSDKKVSEDKNWGFVENNIPCLLSKRLSQLVNEGNANTDLHLVHYGLRQASSSGCPCSVDDACALFTYLSNSLNNVVEKSTGCKSCNQKN